MAYIYMGTGTEGFLFTIEYEGVIVISVSLLRRHPYN